MLDNAGNCYLRTKGVLTPAGQTKPLALQQYGTPCCNRVLIGAVPALGKAMRRRDFIKVIAGSAAAWPLTAHAQKSSTPVVGVLHGGMADGFAKAQVAGFRKRPRGNRVQRGAQRCDRIPMGREPL